MCKFWKRRSWKTPTGFWTPFSVQGDPDMDKPGRREEIYQRVFETDYGRMVLADILAQAGLGRADYEPGIGMSGKDAAFRSGVKAGAFSIATHAGLYTGRLGRALLSGRIEAATHGETADATHE